MVCPALDLASLPWEATDYSSEQRNRYCNAQCWNTFIQFFLKEHKIRGLNPLNAELNPTYHFLALLGAHPILHISRIRLDN
jgi:hypothetical protein